MKTVKYIVQEREKMASDEPPGGWYDDSYSLEYDEYWRALEFLRGESEERFHCKCYDHRIIRRTEETLP